MAVEEIFNVKVASVNIMNYKPKKNVWAVTKAIQTKKKAIVTLKEGSIDLFN